MGIGIVRPHENVIWHFGEANDTPASDVGLIILNGKLGQFSIIEICEMWILVPEFLESTCIICSLQTKLKRIIECTWG